MQPNELIARLIVEDDTAILFDRRDDVERQARSLGYVVQARTSAPSPVGGTLVNICLLRLATEKAATSTGVFLPSDARQTKPTFLRLLDRFFVPSAGDTVISALLFELIATRYEELTTTDVNHHTAEILMRSALSDRPADRTMKVLDFGCGTGCAVSVLRSLGSDGRNVGLFGTDISEAMLAIARGRGEKVAPLQKWRTMPSNGFDAAISCFVLHYGVPADDFAQIARQLKPRGLYVANLFKADDAKLARLIDVFQLAGLDLVLNEHLSTTGTTYNRHLVFRKRSGRLAA